MSSLYPYASTINIMPKTRFSNKAIVMIFDNPNQKYKLNI